ncbi:MAG TPA: FemAB family XrtA/PEP-CTERM system-associated protein [Phycisphaerae bacterium]|nr:FemAB family XrtA/PEP-CTERM system-associated protein [Phycisphaerae bacterium]
MISPAQTGAAVELRPYRDEFQDAWDRYVRAHPSGTLFHLPQWSRAVARAYGHRPCHLTAWRQRRLAGVLPLFLVKSILAGRVLVSLPYATYGGVLADSQAIAAALAGSAKRLCRRLNANYLELRHRDPSGLDLPAFGHYDTFRKALPDRPEDVLPALPKKARAAARNGLRDLGSNCTAVGPDHLDAIFELYACTLRRLGSPNYRRALIRALRDEYGEDCVCLVVRDGGKPVAGVVSFIFRDEIVAYFSGSLPQGAAKNASNVMYLRLMEYAVGRGLRVFDFNRTRRDNRGPHDFKRHLGFEPEPLHYQAFPGKGGETPDLSPSNGRYALAGKVWRKMPLWFTRLAAGRVSKWIP